MDITENLYLKKIIEEDIFKDLKDTYEFSKNYDYESDKDDFEIEIYFSVVILKKICIIYCA